MNPEHLIFYGQSSELGGYDRLPLRHLIKRMSVQSDCLQQLL